MEYETQSNCKLEPAITLRTSVNALRSPKIVCPARPLMSKQIWRTN